MSENNLSTSEILDACNRICCGTASHDERDRRIEDAVRHCMSLAAIHDVSTVPPEIVEEVGWRTLQRVRAEFRTMSGAAA